ncbi:MULTISPECIES: hypothetical protein [Actinomycetes]
MKEGTILENEFKTHLEADREVLTSSGVKGQKNKKRGPYRTRNGSKMEDTHTKINFYARNDLKERLDKLAKKQPKGFRHKLFNDMLEQIIIDLEELSADSD